MTLIKKDLNIKQMFRVREDIKRWRKAANEAEICEDIEPISVTTNKKNDTRRRTKNVASNAATKERSVTKGECRLLPISKSNS